MDKRKIKRYWSAQERKSVWWSMKSHETGKHVFNLWAWLEKEKTWVLVWDAVIIIKFKRYHRKWSLTILPFECQQKIIHSRHLIYMISTLYSFAMRENIQLYVVNDILRVISTTIGLTLVGRVIYLANVSLSERRKNSNLLTMMTDQDKIQLFDHYWHHPLLQMRVLYLFDKAFVWEMCSFHHWR